MQITRNASATTPGPSDWFTGAVYIDTVAAPSAGSRLSASSVHFTPGARTAWHTHPNGQTIYVIEGIGRAQRRGRSEEHTSELQSRRDLVCRLLLEQKNTGLHQVSSPLTLWRATGSYMLSLVPSP